MDWDFISYSNPVINQGEVGYAGDRFYLSVQYTSPPGGFSAGGGLYQWAEAVQYYNGVTNTTH